MQDRQGKKRRPFYKFSNGRKVYMNEFNTPRPCVMVDKMTGLHIKEFRSINKAIEFIRKNTKFKNATRDNVCNVCQGKRHTAYGYKWEYLDKGE